VSKGTGARALACLAFLSSWGAFAQGAPSFALPIDCEIGKSCVLQNYVDRDPGPGARDYRCGPLAYDGHKGTDIRVIDLPAFKRGRVAGGDLSRGIRSLPGIAAAENHFSRTGNARRR
jgi:hypothetical protein